jgi:hypothetical protein
MLLYLPHKPSHAFALRQKSVIAQSLGNAHSIVESGCGRSPTLDGFPLLFLSNLFFTTSACLMRDMSFVRLVVKLINSTI